MRQIWVKVVPWDKDLVTTALEGGADAVLVPEGYTGKVKELGVIDTVSEDGDIKIGEDVVYFNVASGTDEEEVVRICQTQMVILGLADWTIIPIENLIAKNACNIIVEAHTPEDAQTAFAILEKGVERILYVPNDVTDLKKTLAKLKQKHDPIVLKVANIKEIKPIGMGDRVCIDTCTKMNAGEGMLVGNASSALLLIHAESVSNPYVAPRPFRVNAGPVHAYTRVPGGKTRYLSELEAGDPVLIVNYKGEATEAVVGRIKIEKRPLMLLRATVDDKEFTTIVQNAETIRLTSPEGDPLSVTVLKPGDQVLVAIEESGRHFGIKIDEQITEK
jgi:3-dehydroquinate synthase II